MKAIARVTLHLPLLREVPASLCHAVEMVTSSEMWQKWVCFGHVTDACQSCLITICILSHEVSRYTLFKKERMQFWHITEIFPIIWVKLWVPWGEGVGLVRMMHVPCIFSPSLEQRASSRAGCRLLEAPHLMSTLWKGKEWREMNGYKVPLDLLVLWKWQSKRMHCTEMLSIWWELSGNYTKCCH